jgi:hypothetical protein
VTAVRWAPSLGGGFRAPAFGLPERDRDPRRMHALAAPGGRCGDAKRRLPGPAGDFSVSAYPQVWGG